MSIQALSEYTTYSRYAQYLPKKKRRETWSEMVDRVFDMHARKYAKQLDTSHELREEFEFAKGMVLKKRVLGSQRALQFGGPGIEKHNAKIYNCCFTYLDRPRAFQEMVYLLLCGCGVGFSVQSKHVTTLPDIARPDSAIARYQVQDSIEGWADAIGAIVNSYFASNSERNTLEFDYSQVRPEGSLIAGQFIAPGPNGLSSAIEKIRALLDRCLASGRDRLRSIDAYDIVMYASNAVLSGGVRRSATLCLFDYTDNEMLTAKTGDWMIENKQRARSNNSAVLIRDRVTRKEFGEIMTSTKQFGEPGFVFADNEDFGANPCLEISLYAKTPVGESGVQFCNLTEGNGRYCDTREKFLDVCRALAILGTLQAGYTDFNYLTSASREITEREALLGCSITGIMDNPRILLDPENQRLGVKLMRETNERLAAIIGINPAARISAIKPSGTTSCILGTASGIHPHHADRYIRRVQSNRNEFPLKHFSSINPMAVEDSVWDDSGSTRVISFLCEVPKGAIRKNQLGAVELLEKVRLTQQNWIEEGTVRERCVKPWLKHNVSNTITVRGDEWEAVTDYLYEHRDSFVGVSLLSSHGELDYPQAPFTAVQTADELVKEYGDGVALASGLIVDGLTVFGNDLWKACSAIGRSEGLTDGQRDWTRRAVQFADRYFGKDAVRMTRCLKGVHTLKTWLDLKREYREVDWSLAVEDRAELVRADTLGAQACSGGACEIV